MRCASVLLESNELSREVNQLTDEDVYDVPRGLTKMPIREGGRRSRTVGDDNIDEDDLDQWTMYDSKESKAIMQNDSVRSKMVQTAGGETFFSVITKRS
jgi:hypothetical protein